MTEGECTIFRNILAVSKVFWILLLLFLVYYCVICPKCRPCCSSWHFFLFAGESRPCIHLYILMIAFKGFLQPWGWRGAHVCVCVCVCVCSWPLVISHWQPVVCCCFNGDLIWVAVCDTMSPFPAEVVGEWVIMNDGFPLPLVSVLALEAWALFTKASVLLW